MNITRDAARHRLRGALMALAVALLLGPFVACDGFQVGGDNGDISTEDTPDSGGFDLPTDQANDPGDDRGDAGVTFNVPQATDSCVVDALGGVCRLFDGEVELSVSAGAFSQSETLTATRRVISADGRDYVGYVWGPHGLPIEPPGSLTLMLPMTYVSVTPTGLATWDGAGAIITIPGAEVQAVGSMWRIRGELAILHQLLVTAQ